MNTYRVTWGVDVADVYAADENEAWAKFCQGHDVARVHPHLHKREVKVVEATKPADKPKPVENQWQHARKTSKHA
jgi:hypothetical protein